MTETWKPIKGYEGLYEISNLGNVKSLMRIHTIKIDGRDPYTRINKEKILKQRVNKDKYHTIKLHLNGKKKEYPIHRLVAGAFIENPLNKPEVNHDNGIKSDNKVENLTWMTRSENIKHAYDTGLNKIGVKIRCITHNRDFKSIAAAARYYKCSYTGIINVLRGKCKTTAGLKFIKV